MKIKCPHCLAENSLGASDFLNEFVPHAEILNIQVVCSSCGEEIHTIDVALDFELKELIVD